MTKSKIPMEYQAFADKIKHLDSVLSVEVNRHEVRAEIYLKNESWGLPGEIHDCMVNPPMNEKMLIDDMSHIQELEKGGVNMTVYFVPTDDV